ncbi:MAG: zinc ABC transporter substrate-binding protein [Clostridia bacterium]|nr:zinc ABC transporter substrate-binding protein [Clostridia bacterium]
MKKRLISLLLILMLMLSVCACSSAPEDDGKLNIVCTTFPIYDWTRNVLGNHASDVELTLLLNSGADLHNYQPSTADLLTLRQCDLFIYIGGESDNWVDNALKSAPNENRQALALIDSVSLLEHKHEEDHDEHEDHDAGHEHAMDEHIWLSLKNADTLVSVIAEKLGKADSKNAKDYTANAEEYKAKLNALDAQYQECVDNAEDNTLVFAGQFPFLYMAEDYKLDCHAATNSCSATLGDSPTRIIELAQIVQEQDLPAVLLIETTNRSDAETIIETAGGKERLILTMDSMQSVTQERVESNITYLQIMESNLSVLQQALSKGE